MNRKIFVFSCLLPTILLLTDSLAEAQERGRVARIGFLGGFSGPSPNIEAFRQGLRDLGYVEGKNLVIEFRYSERKYDLERASELVHLKVDVIIVSNTRGAVAAKKATRTIPIVMTSSSDPVGSGLVASLARPGGNVTGLTSVSAELGGKLLELLKEVVPGLSRVAIALPRGPADRLFVKATEGPAKAMGVQLIHLTVRGPIDYEAAVRVAIKERANAVLSRLGPVPPIAHRKQFMELAVKSRLPVVSGHRQDTEAGALLSYGWDRKDSYRRAAFYVDKILKGAKPGDLPVEAPTKFELVVNLKAAQQMGLKIPDSVLFRADKVIK